MVWPRELGTVVNWTNILDGVIGNAAWVVAGMAIKPWAGWPCPAAYLDTAACEDTNRTPGMDLGLDFGAGLEHGKVAV